jgi:hypothetical protein
MALVDSVFSDALKTIFDTAKSAAETAPKDDQWLADQLALAIDTQIKTAVVNVPGQPPGTLS